MANHWVLQLSLIYWLAAISVNGRAEDYCISHIDECRGEAIISENSSVCFDFKLEQYLKIQSQPFDDSTTSPFALKRLFNLDEATKFKILQTLNPGSTSELYFINPSAI